MKDTIRYDVAPYLKGFMLIAKTHKGMCALILGYSPHNLVHRLRQMWPHASLINQNVDFDLPLDLEGTLFQIKVWQTLQTIKPGTVITYRELAHKIEHPSAVRAVAQACAHNRIAIRIPCHRVIRSNGTLSGYRWGTEWKRELLQQEGYSYVSYRC